VLQNAPTNDEAEKSRSAFNQNVFASTVYETEHPVVRVHPGLGPAQPAPVTSSSSSLA